MSNTIIISKDGSSTLKPEGIDETYHSIEGAYTEAEHIYIKTGIEHLCNKTNNTEINIFDVGLGTGLNAILTYLWQNNNATSPIINYYGIEKYPLEYCKVKELNYPEYICSNHVYNTIDSINEFIQKLHSSAWGEKVKITDKFNLHKINGDILNYQFDVLLESTPPTVVFYDTFSPNSQPQLWSKNIFDRLAQALQNKESILVTYCSKGIVKQALRDAGFTIERLPGPPMKRHILRASLNASIK